VSILKIAKFGHPILLKKTQEVKDIGSEKIKKIIYDMSETMLDYNGVGLAAPQVHINKSIFVFRNPENLKKDSNIEVSAIINPTIEKIGDKKNDDWEGCLSIPNMLGLVRRFSEIQYTGYDIFGNKLQVKAKGLHARIIQHEFDHLKGVLYTKRLAHRDAFGFENEIERYWKKKENEKK